MGDAENISLIVGSLYWIKFTIQFFVINLRQGLNFPKKNNFSIKWVLESMIGTFKMLQTSIKLATLLGLSSQHSHNATMFYGPVSVLGVGLLQGKGLLSFVQLKKSYDIKLKLPAHENCNHWILTTFIIILGALPNLYNFQE